MLPPVLEVYVIWHPTDSAGREAADQIFEHFHGTAFTGLIGGALEVYVRSEGWHAAGEAPRPICYPGTVGVNGLATPHLVAVVPILGTELAAVVEGRGNSWRSFCHAIADAQRAAPDHVGIYPLVVDNSAIDGTELGRIFGGFQRIAAPSPFADQESLAELRCRDLAQGMAQLAAGSGARLQVFISHTKRLRQGEEEDVASLIAMVRTIIGETRLRQFFDANDLQPGQDWDDRLRSEASTSAMLAIRTDLYTSRAWCQREMLTAKRSGMPIVILDSLGLGEERGSFLMDHVPRIPVRDHNSGSSKQDIRRGLNLLVDECLKRALWKIQERLAEKQPLLEVNWWAPHAPEPVTLAQWLEDGKRDGTCAIGDADLRILHPDPPLGPEEVAALQQMIGLMGHRGLLDVMTPRMLSARGG